MQHPRYLLPLDTHRVPLEIRVLIKSNLVTVLMSDRILIPLPGLGTLDLPREVFEQHLIKPAIPVGPEPQVELVDAGELEKRTGIPASWWMNQARERRVPFRKFGRYVRFDLSEVMQCDASGANQSTRPVGILERL